MEKGHPSKPPEKAALIFPISTKETVAEDSLDQQAQVTGLKTVRGHRLSTIGNRCRFLKASTPFWEGIASVYFGIRLLLCVYRKMKENAGRRAAWI